MEEASSSRETGQADPPLWSIGLAVVLILIAPALLYLLAPSGPLREGDTIFSEGQQQVTIIDAIAPVSRNDKTCLLNPGNPLIILQSAVDRSDGMILARVQGNAGIEWPFCPPHASVGLRPHQIFQKPDLLGSFKAKLAGLIGPAPGR